MEVLNFAEANCLLTAPKGQEEVVGALPVLRTDGCLISCWLLSDKDLALIQTTKRVWLQVWSGATQPPVAVSVERPYDGNAPRGKFRIATKRAHEPETAWKKHGGDPQAWNLTMQLANHMTATSNMLLRDRLHENHPHQSEAWYAGFWSVLTNQDPNADIRDIGLPEGLPLDEVESFGYGRNAGLATDWITQRRLYSVIEATDNDVELLTPDEAQGLRLDGAMGQTVPRALRNGQN